MTNANLPSEASTMKPSIPRNLLIASLGFGLEHRIAEVADAIGNGTFRTA